MTAATTTEDDKLVENLAVDCILLEGYDTPLDEAHVATLVGTIGAGGLIQNLAVRRTPTGDKLVAGRHRLAALKRLGWTHVRCTVELTADDEAAAKRAELQRLSENIHRSTASWQQAAADTARYEELLALTKAPGALGSWKAGRGSRGKTKPGGNADIARQTGQSAHTVKDHRRHTKALKEVGLAPAALVGTSLDSKREADALNMLPASLREAIAAAAIAGEKVSAVEDLAKQPPPPKKPRTGAPTAAEKAAVLASNERYAKTHMPRLQKWYDQTAGDHYRPVKFLQVARRKVKVALAEAEKLCPGCTAGK